MRALCLAALFVAGCQETNGEGFVRGTFEVEECTRKEKRVFEDFNYEPTRYATTRFNEVLFILLQDDAVDPIESDVLEVRIPDVRPIQMIEERPIRLPISLEPDQINMTLSLYETCPRRPQLHALGGEIRFDVFEIAIDPEDSGDQEILRGSITATISGPDRVKAVGFVTAEFDFFPRSRAPSEAF